MPRRSPRAKARKRAKMTKSQRTLSRPVAREAAGRGGRLAGLSGGSRFRGAVVRCCVCEHAITVQPEMVLCSHGDQSGPLHPGCVDRWVCATDRVLN